MSQLPVLRSDLIIQQRQRDGECLIFDPVAGSYFLFGRQEQSMALALPGCRNVSEWVQRWNRQQRTSALDDVAAEQFLRKLMRDQLVTVDVAGYGDRLQQIRKFQETHHRRRWRRNPLAIRFNGVDPAGALKMLAPTVGWVFQPVMMVVISVLLVLALSVVFLAATALPTVPSLDWLVSLPGICTMALVFVAVKVSHELGHAIAAEFHGARCRQIGVMLLFFMPTLYCDVSDAWRLENRWQRIAISAAGIFVELILAMVAAVGWALTAPGIANAVFFQVMFVCGVSSILVNGNPLLRYDGYFVLSDLWGRPNLRQSARRELQRAMDWSRRTHQTASVNWGLVGYQIASLIYRAFVLGTIATTMVCVANEFSLGWLGWLLVACLICLTVNPIWQWAPRGGDRRRAFSQFSAVLAGLGIIAAVCIPLPSWEYVDFQVHPLQQQTIFATVDGELDANQMVTGPIDPGQPIARIHNAEIEFQLSASTIAADRSRQDLWQLERRAQLQPELNETVAAVRQQVRLATARWNNMKRRQQKLTMVSSQEGRVESLLVPANPGRELTVYQVRRGQPIARVVDQSQRQVRLLVGEKQVDRLRAGQSVVLSSAMAGMPVHHGTVGQVMVGRWPAVVDVREQNGGTVDFATVDDGANDPAATEQSNGHFLVTVKTDPAGPELPEVFTGGRARVRVAPLTIASRLVRLFRQAY